MKIRLSKTPFDSHDNILFSFIKQHLVGDRIYDKSEYAFPYTKIKKKYEITIETDNKDAIFIKYNQIDYLQFSGELSYSFYVLPLLGKNLIEVFNAEGHLIKSYQFNCYNIHMFLASMANEFKKIWNSLYQASANSYYDLNRVKDLNGNPLIGASITIKGTNTSTTTNNQGEFQKTEGSHDGFLRNLRRLPARTVQLWSLLPEIYFP